MEFYDLSCSLQISYAMLEKWAFYSPLRPSGTDAFEDKIGRYSRRLDGIAAKRPALSLREDLLDQRAVARECAASKRTSPVRTALGPGLQWRATAAKRELQNPSIQSRAVNFAANMLSPAHTTAGRRAPSSSTSVTPLTQTSPSSTFTGILARCAPLHGPSVQRPVFNSNFA